MEGFLDPNEVLKKLKLKEGMKVHGKIDIEHRKQLAQHHTATHIVNAAARKILGNHINQASAKKTREKATLDITHYQSLSGEETKKIENEANKIVNSRIDIIKKFYPRTEAEKRFGMSIYQGGAVPGKKLRIVQIKGLDTQACGGTHLNSTFEAGKIKILKSTKISDSGWIANYLSLGHRGGLPWNGSELHCECAGARGSGCHRGRLAWRARTSAPFTDRGSGSGGVSGRRTAKRQRCFHMGVTEICHR